MPTTTFIKAVPQSIHKQLEGAIENRVLACLPESEQKTLAPYFRQVPLKQGSVLHEPETPVETVYFPLSGAVSLLAVTKGGEAVQTAIVGPEGAVGLFGHIEPWLANTRAIVQVPGIAKAISTAVLWSAIVQSEPARDLIAQYIEKLLEQTQQIVACNALHSVEERVASWLRRISDRINSAEIPITQEILGQMLGVRRTTVTIVAQKLQRDGIIRYRRGHIVIADPIGLRGLACECYDARR
jgi:CRP-like cAMP-binding protein